MQKCSFRQQQLSIAAIITTLLTTCLSSACGGSSTNVKPDTRTRHNEPHITIHQDATRGDPIVGWAIENGNPSKNTFRASVRFLELSVLGTAEHPSRCAIVIEKLVSQQPDEDPVLDDPVLLDPSAQPAAERSYTIPCSEREKSTRIAWPDVSIVLSGHIDEAGRANQDGGSESDDRWEFVIDEVSKAPRITRLDDPEGSLMWTAPSPSPKPWEIVNRLRPDGRACFSVIQSKNFDRASISCGRAADDFEYAAYHVSGARATPSDVATAVIISSLYRKGQSLALHELGSDGDSKNAFYEGRGLLRALVVTVGCPWCQNEAKKALREYGDWPPRNYDV
jgi:hypothetical protein